jgi:ABC-type antimicrobial peptide transport system permease subunit
MFFAYLWNELRRRSKQVVVVSTSLGIGIGLVVAVAAVSAGVRDAQAEVLGSLYGVGTDITVTRSAAQGEGPAGFQIGASSDAFARDRLVLGPGRASFSETKAADLASVDGVAVAVGALSLTDLRLRGELPAAAGSGASLQVPPSGAPAGSTQIDVDTSQIVGVDVERTDVGPLASLTLAAGRAVRAGDEHADVAVVDAGYANEHDITVGDTVRVAGERFDVVGVTQPPVGGSSFDIAIPLARAQALASLRGEIDTVYIKAASAASVDATKAAIRSAMPGATVSTSSDLASQVSGSLGNAASLVSTLGRWLSVAALGGAVALACLLTIGAVGRRTRELGTLQALGWRRRRLVGQLLGESLVVGLLGGLVGIAIGVAGAWAIGRLAPTLTAEIAAAGGLFAQGGGADPFTRSVDVALTAPVSAALAALAIGLSVLGGLVAGAFGGWRAARMRPADAMRQLV